MIARLRGHDFGRTDLVLGLMADQDSNVCFYRLIVCIQL